MERVDRVWGQVPFRTPWSGARERQELRKALVRFLAWCRSSGHPRAARHRAAARRRASSSRTAPRSSCYGYADRLELDADGRVVVVDLKTGKYPPTNDEVAVHPQLGLYQLAVENGALESTCPRVSVGDRGRRRAVAAAPRRRAEAQGPAPGAQEPDEDGPRPIERQLVERRPAAARGAVPRPAGRALPPLRLHGRCARPSTPGRCCRDARRIDSPEQLRDLQELHAD